MNSFDLLVTKIFLRTYFLKNSLLNSILKKIVNLFAFVLNRDLRRLLIRDFLEHISYNPDMSKSSSLKKDFSARAFMG